jgi:hypothetical protein
MVKPIGVVGVLALVAVSYGSSCVCGGTGGGAGGGTGGGSGTGGGMPVMRDCPVSNVPVGTAGTGAKTVSGKASYEFVPTFYGVQDKVGGLDFAKVEARPVRGAVAILLRGKTELAKVVTTDKGEFTFKYDSSSAESLTIALTALTQTPCIQIEDNTSKNAVWSGSKTFNAGEATVDLLAPNGWNGTRYEAARRLAAPFAILDSMYTAAQSFLAVRKAANFPALFVNWSPNNRPERSMPPADEDFAAGKVGTSFFSPFDGELYILGKDGADADEFDSHVIVHEWGHYFEANLSRSDSPGGQHGPGDKLEPRIAFGEGWGNAVASMVLPEPLYVDTSWNPNTGELRAFGFDAETPPNPTDDKNPSAFSESSVLRILYDIYDGANEPFDAVNLGLGPIYDVLTGPQKNTKSVTTLASFITGLKAQPGVVTADIDKLLQNYQIGPLRSDYGDGDKEMREIFTDASILPFSGSVEFLGGEQRNFWQQNQYFVFTGNGKEMTLSANANQDVLLLLYGDGKFEGGADNVMGGGDERATFESKAGAKYVLIVTGLGEQKVQYKVQVSIK